jgi:coproporphyrinogen III oxidase-like Fe-S oxidoreductase
MCNGYLDFDEMAREFNLSEFELKSILDYTPEKLSEFIEDGLVTIDDKTIRVNQQGMLVVRNIAMAFDPLLDVKQGMYSKTI